MFLEDCVSFLKTVQYYSSPATKVDCALAVGHKARPDKGRQRNVKKHTF